MFRAFSRPSSRAQWLQWQPLVLPLERGGSSAATHDCHQDTKIKPKAATAVVELLMMGGKRLETCWAVNKRHDNKLEDCCIWLVIYLNCTMMHRLANLKFRTVHVLDSFSVHHQESSTVYTATGICHTGYVDCLLAGSGCSNLVPLASSQHNLYDIYLLLCIQN